MGQPTFAAQMNLAGDATGYFILGRARLGLTSGARLLGQFSDSGFTDLAARLMGFRTFRGREDELSGIAAGTVEADFDDDDGALDEGNTASPYYPNVKLMKRLRVAASIYDYETTILNDLPTGYWRLGDPAVSAVAADSSGNGYDGAYVGGVTLEQAGALSVDPDTAALLASASSQYITTPANAAFDTLSFSWEIWFKQTIAGTYGLIRKTSAMYPRLYIQDGATPVIVIQGFSPGAVGTTTAPFAFNAWTHVVVTYDGTSLRLYVNGVLAGGPTAATIVNTLNATYEIGRIGAGFYFNGLLDEIAFYPTALSAARILAHYQASSKVGGDRREYPLGYAFADDYAGEPTAIGADVSVHATDLFTRMSREREDVAYPEQMTHDRLNALLNTLEWPADLRAIDDGTLLLPAAVIGKTTTMLAHVDTVMKAELGQFFVGGEGAPTFHNRVRRYLASSRGTFGAGGLKIRSILTSFNDAGLLNRVSVTRTAGVEQLAADVDSKDAYDTRGYSLDQAAADLLPDDTQALSWATTVKNRRAQPIQRITGIEIDPADDDTLWWHVLDAEIGDLITLTHDVPGTKGLVASDFFIESIRHGWELQGNPPFVCRWGLSLAPSDMPAFILGNAHLGNAYLSY